MAQKTQIKASQQILQEILSVQESIEQGKPLNQYYLNDIVCLTNLPTLKQLSDDFGTEYFPSLEEVQIWKEWFEKNQSKISYVNNYQPENPLDPINLVIIQVEYEKRKYRNTNCDRHNR